MEIGSQVNTVSGQQCTSGYPESTTGMDYTLIGEKGQIIDGVITKVSDKISINFNGREVTVPKSAVQDAMEGEIRSFEIKDVTKTSIVLKEVEKTSQCQPGVGVMQTKVEDGNSFEQQLERTQQEEPNLEEVEEEIENVSNRLTERDIALMEEEGMSLEKYNLERLERVLDRIKESRIFKEKNLERIAGERQEHNKVMEEIAVKNKIRNMTGGGMKQQIAECLEKADLPVTEENIEKITNAMNMAQIVPKLSDKAAGYLIAQQLEPTVENMYQAQYASNSQNDGYKNGALMPSYMSVNYSDRGYGTMSHTASSYQAAVRDGEVFYEIQPKQDMEDQQMQNAAWEQLRPQIEAVMEEAGMEVTDEALEKAKWLLQRELPITPENIKSLQQIEQAKEQFNIASLLNQMVQTYAKGETPEQAPVVASINYTQQTVDAFLAEIKQQMKEIEDKGMIETIQDTSKEAVLVSDYLSIDHVTKYRQLEEVRLKMTVEAANRLAEKGIKLDTTQLSKVVEGLREIENQYYRNLLEEGNAIAGEENIALLKETTDKINQLKETPDYILGVTFYRRAEIDVSQLHKEAVSMKQQMDKASQTYDALMTEPRKDLGDSIKKAFRNIDEILKDLGMEQTQANERAVKILGYNRMEITKENISYMKEYDEQVNQLMTKLHPAVTVELIRKGVNPLDMPVGELNQKIQEIKEELGISEEEKYSRFLWKMEKNQEITQKERETFIGVYRLLNNVEKTDGAAVGHVLQAEQEVTLRNLFTAVKTIKKGSVDLTMEEDTGLSEITFSREPFIQQLENNFSHFSKNNQEEKQADYSYMQQVVQSLYEEITPESLHQAAAADNIQQREGEEAPALLDMSIEKLLEEVRKQAGIEKTEKNIQKQNNQELNETEQLEYETEFLKSLQALKQNSKQAIEFLTAQQMPVNVKNLISAQEILGNTTILKKWKNKIKDLPEEERKEAEELLETFSDGLESEKAMEEKYSTLGKSVNAILNKEYSCKDNTANQLMEWKNFSNCMEMIQSLSQKKSYEIPIAAGEGITRLHVTLINEKENAGKVEIKVNSEQLGNIQGIFSVKDQEVKGYVLGDNQEGLRKLEEMEEQWNTRLQEEEICLKEIHFQSKVNDTESVKKIKYKKQEETTDTKTLYQVAKTFVQQVKELERGTYHEN